MADWLKGTSKKKIISNRLKKIFLGRLYSNLLIYMIIIGLAITAASYLAPKEQEVAGHLVNITCPEPEPCIQNECPRLDCSECPVEIVKETSFLIRCPNGMIVNNSENCIEEFPEITSPYFTTINGVTVSLDDVELETEGNETRITRIDYSIINQGDVSVKPKIWVKVYKAYTYEIRDSMGIKTFNHDVLDVNGWIQIKQDTNILVKDFDEKTIRLELLDSLPDPDEKMGSVYTAVSDFE